jgi:NADH-quinone oxidoreductase subunit G
MPDSHRLNFHYIDSDARLTEPLLRSVNGAHNPITWSEAYAKIAQELQKFSATQIAVIASGRMTNEELYLAKQLTQQLGVTALSVVPRIGEADHLLVAADKNPNTTGAKLILQQADPSSQLNAVREGVRSGAISALISLGEDLISDAEFTADDLSKLSFHLHVNHSANPTASAANVVLPSSAFTEKRGSMVNLSGRLQRLNQATMPLGQAHDDWEILRDLIQVISKEKLSIPTIENVFKKLGEDVAEFSNMTLSRISDQGVVITETNYQIPLLANERASKAAGTING